MTPDPSIAVRNPADLVDATPYVIGFHPTESLVVLGLSAGRVCFGARYDLPPPESDDIVHLGAIIAAQRARCVAVLAYGPPATADPVVRRALAVLDAFRVRVLEAVRVHDGRWWSYFCSNSVCCPAEGTPFDSATSLIAAEATYRGQVALPSRQALVAMVAPVDGQARAAMTAATERARSALDVLLTAQEHSARAIRRAGRLAVREAEKRYRSGRALTDDEIAWLGVLLLDPDVHEYTLGRVGDEEWRLALWTDVMRRVEPIYVPAVGCVLSYLAWRAGQGALARVAVDRALRAQPDHRMAALLDEVLGMGIGPHAMTALDSPHRTVVLLRSAQPGEDHAQPRGDRGRSGGGPARPGADRARPSGGRGRSGEVPGEPGADRAQPSGGRGRFGGVSGGPGADGGQPSAGRGWPGDDCGHRSGDRGWPAEDHSHLGADRGLLGEDRGQPGEVRARSEGGRDQPGEDRGQPGGDRGQPSGDRGQPGEGAVERAADRSAHPEAGPIAEHGADSAAGLYGGSPVRPSVPPRPSGPPRPQRPLRRVLRRRSKS